MKKKAASQNVHFLSREPSWLEKTAAVSSVLPAFQSLPFQRYDWFQRDNKRCLGFDVRRAINRFLAPGSAISLRSLRLFVHVEKPDGDLTPLVMVSPGKEIEL